MIFSTLAIMLYSVSGRSSFTSDGIGSDDVRVVDGAMVDDRATLLPGSTLEDNTVFSSGALAVGMLLITTPEAQPSTPFGRVFCDSKAPYQVFGPSIRFLYASSWPL
ncbi:hypothetical protein BJ546DRAFT_188473 [Cryomyces antarcticus]